jgi:hypothetical protein
MLERRASTTAKLQALREAVRKFVSSYACIANQQASQQE